MLRPFVALLQPPLDELFYTIDAFATLNGDNDVTEMAMASRSSVAAG